jgi:hypothetical protein
VRSAAYQRGTTHNEGRGALVRDNLAAQQQRTVRAKGGGVTELTKPHRPADATATEYGPLFRYPSLLRHRHANAWHPVAPEGIGGAFSAVSEPHPLRLVKESRAGKPSGKRARLRKRRWGRLFSHVVAYRTVDVNLVGLRNGW